MGKMTMFTSKSIN